jgi:NADH:ubiquinone oxidoreductase subunit 6 (subunit J)
MEVQALLYIAALLSIFFSVQQLLTANCHSGLHLAIALIQAAVAQLLKPHSS